MLLVGILNDYVIEAWLFIVQFTYTESSSNQQGKSYCIITENNIIWILNDSSWGLCLSRNANTFTSGFSTNFSVF